MTEPMKTYDELYSEMLKHTNVEETDQSTFDKEVAILYAAQQVAAERERIKTELKEKLNGNFKMSLQRAARIQQYLPKNEILELIDSL